MQHQLRVLLKLTAAKPRTPSGVCVICNSALLAAVRVCSDAGQAVPLCSGRRRRSVSKDTRRRRRRHVSSVFLRLLTCFSVVFFLNIIQTTVNQKCSSITALLRHRRFQTRFSARAIHGKFNFWVNSVRGRVHGRDRVGWGGRGPVWLLIPLLAVAPGLLTLIALYHLPVSIVSVAITPSNDCRRLVFKCRQLSCV